MLTPRADSVAIVEALYGAEPDPIEWSRKVFDAVGSIVTTRAAIGLTVIAYEDDYTRSTPIISASNDPALTEVLRRVGVTAARAATVQAFRVLRDPGQPCMTHRELESGLSGHVLAALGGCRAIPQAWDVVGLFAYPVPGLASVLWMAIDQDHTLDPAERRLLRLVAGHVNGALRLRTRPDLAIAAVVPPDGDRQPDSLDDWRALVDGRYSVVPREDRDGKRYYLLVVNHPAAQEHVRFSPREQDVLRLAALGFGGMNISCNLGISESLVSKALKDAATKVGLSSRQDLIKVGAATLGVAPERFDLDHLTPAERDVLDLLRRGLSNAEIGHLRQSSRHTVANQVSAILRKTGLRSRHGLT